MIVDYDKIINKLAADLDNRVLRSQLIASNVANVDTPGYKGKDLAFREVFQQSMDGIDMKRTHVKHISEGTELGTPGTTTVEDPSPGRPDGNNVNIDEEMLKLTENNIKYNVAVQLMSKKLRHIHEAITLSK